ncbi:methylated-DNA-[protein]-cysteine S-methyltransferase [Microbacterium resistens]|uniref:Methylated-DNA-[protein]-cysteine S-methyltransferase n=1 Tax=Microbacterium resistens TaxID=156977 RepID=A0ABU1SEP7_9MICO|nr:methylated-DNA--[protein]-cysteine S-methyltransferase [Microbacterium resistens]MDR6868065.1 methylated-DNA-[protein]-cysteine S-methyltransferase [Microbacterium resistens]
MTALIHTVDTADGAFTFLLDDEDRVLASGWTADHGAILDRLAPANRPSDVRSASGAATRTAASEAVGAYYAGDLSAIDEIPVHQFGTEMQRSGWAALRRIVPGAPLSYAAFAEALGRPTAVRAVGSICARNAAALFVPCHRVLRSDGSFGGFAWGTAVKGRLLDREAVA